MSHRTSGCLTALLPDCFEVIADNGFGARDPLQPAPGGAAPHALPPGTWVKDVSVLEPSKIIRNPALKSLLHSDELV